MEAEKTSQSKGMYWTGWVLSILPAGMMIAGAIYGLLNPGKMAEQFKQFHYPDGAVIPLIYVELACAILYLIPQTAVLGAILLTGYLGGATNHHVHAGESILFVPVLIGVVIWLGLYLREPRLRSLVPLRSRR